MVFVIQSWTWNAKTQFWYTVLFSRVDQGKWIDFKCTTLKFSLISLNRRSKPSVFAISSCNCFSLIILTQLLLHRGRGILDKERKLTCFRSVRPLPQVDHDSQQDKGWFYHLQQRRQMLRSRLRESWQKKKRSNSGWIASGARLRLLLEDWEEGVGRSPVWVGWRIGRSWFLIAVSSLCPDKDMKSVKLRWIHIVLPSGSIDVVEGSSLQTHWATMTAGWKCVSIDWTMTFVELCAELCSRVTKKCLSNKGRSTSSANGCQIR